MTILAPRLTRGSRQFVIYKKKIFFHLKETFRTARMLPDSCSKARVNGLEDSDTHGLCRLWCKWRIRPEWCCWRRCSGRSLPGAIWSAVGWHWRGLTSTQTGSSCWRSGHGSWDRWESSRRSTWCCSLEHGRKGKSVENFRRKYVAEGSCDAETRPLFAQLTAGKIRAKRKIRTSILRWKFRKLPASVRVRGARKGNTYRDNKFEINQSISVHGASEGWSNPIWQLFRKADGRLIST